MNLPAHRPTPAGRRGRVAAAAAGGCLLLLLLRVILSRRPELEAILLPVDAYAAIQPWWGNVTGLVIMGIGIARAERSWLRVAAATAAGLLILITSQTAYAAFSVPTKLTGRPGPNGVCLQTTGYTCGPAAAATLLARLGVPTDEREMAGLCGTSPILGTDIYPLGRGLRAKLAGSGRNVDVVRGDWESLRKLKSPALAVVRFTAVIDHVVVILNAGEDSVQIADPLSGVRESPRAEFESRWRGYLVTVE